MNSILRYKWIISIASLLVLINGCAKDDDPDSQNAHELIIKVLDGNNNDITETDAIEDIVLYLFGEKNIFLDSIPIPIDIIRNRKPVIIHYPEHAYVTASLWCNTKGPNTIEDDVNPGHHTESPLSIRLAPFDEEDIKKRKNTSTIYKSPEDLFHGHQRVNLDISKGDPNTEFTVKRKVASIVVIAKKLKEWSSNGADNEYHILIRGTKHAFDLVDGDLSGEDAIHWPETTFDTNGVFSSSVFNTFPSDRSQRVEVEFYKGDDCIFRATLDKDGNPLVAEPGKTLQVSVDFGSTVTVNVSVNKWYEINQDWDL